MMSSRLRCVKEHLALHTPWLLLDRLASVGSLGFCWIAWLLLDRLATRARELGHDFLASLGTSTSNLGVIENRFTWCIAANSGSFTNRELQAKSAVSAAGTWEFPNAA